MHPCICSNSIGHGGHGYEPTNTQSSSVVPQVFACDCRGAASLYGHSQLGSTGCIPGGSAPMGDEQPGAGSAGLRRISDRLTGRAAPPSAWAAERGTAGGAVGNLRAWDQYSLYRTCSASARFGAAGVDGGLRRRRGRTRCQSEAARGARGVNFILSVYLSRDSTYFYHLMIRKGLKCRGSCDIIDVNSDEIGGG